MGINFPATPAVGELHPNPAQAGIPQYKWDGATWVTVAAAGDTGYVKRTGDIMSGLLTLSGNPVGALDAVPKQYAAPLDALAYSGMQINGGVEISQQHGGNTIAVTNYASTPVMDGWRAAAGHASATFTVNLLDTGTATLASGVYFPRVLGFGATAAMPSVGAADFAYLVQPIEGYRTSRLGWGTAAARPLTIAFWVSPPVSGTLAVAVQNKTNSRSYIVDVPVVAGWQYKTVTIPGETSGAWEKGSETGISLYFSSMAGSNYRAAANTWHATNVFTTAATTNFFTAQGNTIFITGVVVLPGIYAPTAEQSPLIMRPYNQELVTCQRYYEKGVEPLLYRNSPLGVTAAYDEVRFVATKRAAPTISITATWEYYSGATNTPWAPTGIGPYFDKFTFNCIGATNWCGWTGAGTWAADARL